MKSESTAESAAQARRARFGALPERVRYEDMLEEHPASPKDPAGEAYRPEGAWASWNCLAVDLGL